MNEEEVRFYGLFLIKLIYDLYSQLNKALNRKIKNFSDPMHLRLDQAVERFQAELSAKILFELSPLPEQRPGHSPDSAAVPANDLAGASLAFHLDLSHSSFG